MPGRAPFHTVYNLAKAGDESALAEIKHRGQRLDTQFLHTYLKRVSPFLSDEERAREMQEMVDQIKHIRQNRNGYFDEVLVSFINKEYSALTVLAKEGNESAVKLLIKLGESPYDALNGYVLGNHIQLLKRLITELNNPPSRYSDVPAARKFTSLNLLEWLHDKKEALTQNFVLELMNFCKHPKTLVPIAEKASQLNPKLNSENLFRVFSKIHKIMQEHQLSWNQAKMWLSPELPFIFLQFIPHLKTQGIPLEISLNIVYKFQLINDSGMSEKDLFDLHQKYINHTLHQKSYKEIEKKYSPPSRWLQFWSFLTADIEVESLRKEAIDSEKEEADEKYNDRPLWRK